MKRLLVLVAVLAPLSLFIAGCGGSGGSSGKLSSGMPSEDQKQKMQEMMNTGKAKMMGQPKAAATPGGAPTK